MYRIIGLLVLLISCSQLETVTEEIMLPDGNTWKIQTFLPNNERTLYEECLEIKTKTMSKCIHMKQMNTAKTQIAKRSIELCGVKPDRFFGCSSKNRGTHKAYQFITCYAQCLKKQN